MNEEIKVSEMAEATSYGADDMFMTVSSGSNKKMKIAKINDFSTSEIACGTWTDGRTIYRVVKSIGNLPNNDRLEVSFENIIPDDVTCTNVYGIGERISSSVTDYRSLESLTSLFMYRIESYTLYVDTDTDNSAWTGTAIIEYVKNTN